MTPGGAGRAAARLGVSEPWQVRPLALLSREAALEMLGASWSERCPVEVEVLAYLSVEHWGFDERLRLGELVVHRELVDEVAEIFRELLAARFPVDKVRLMGEYDGDDERAMADNNSSAFNCRTIAGTDILSFHSYGVAIDINPWQNPYVRPGKVSPAGSSSFLDRRGASAGMILPGAPCHSAFSRRGWSWGGQWTHVIDYHHFEKPLEGVSRDDDRPLSPSPGCEPGTTT